MKLFLFLSYLPIGINAFAPAPTFGARSSTAISAAGADAVADALAITKKFGARSPEAALAWDEIEEINASDNSVAYSGSTDTDEMQEKFKILGELLQESKSKLESIKTLTTEVQAVKLQATSAVNASVDSVAMKSVLAEARNAEEKFGKGSVESKLAWEAVEEVASSDMSGSMITSLEDECLVEALEACAALDELNRAIEGAQRP
mmetsp:Transcript_8971/g.19833  ORF Transcript_8971/g.19833 Transcript_8971/m.19833 type:complete len:205 (-) Transcript_8971:286-900(-)